jgi:hypothetical protein
VSSCDDSTTVGVARSILDLISAFAVIIYVLPAFLVWMAPMLWCEKRLF